MKGFTIQHSIDLLEKAVKDGGGSSGATTAADVSYDNTTSHLTADDVQEAIDELNTAIGLIETGVHYSTSERKIGTWLEGEDLYQRTYIYENTSGLSGSSDYEIATLTSDINVKEITGIILSSADHKSYPVPYIGSSSKATVARIDSDNKLVINCNGDSWATTYTPIIITIRYTKTPAQSTRSKKK